MFLSWRTGSNEFYWARFKISQYINTYESFKNKNVSGGFSALAPFYIIVVPLTTLYTIKGGYPLLFRVILNLPSERT